MMKALVSFLALSVLAELSAAAPWARVGGGAYDETFLDMVLSPDGRRTVLGYSSSVSSAGSDVWMLSYNSTGKLLWQKALGLDYVEYGGHIVLTPDGGSVIAGWSLDDETFQSDIWVVKLDAKRKTQWQKTIGGPDYEDSREVILTSDGGYLICGVSMSFGQGSLDGWLVRLDASGEILWQKTYGGVESDTFRTVVERPDGTLLAYGSTFSFGAGGEDMWLVSLTATGDVVWARSYGGAKDDGEGRMLLDPDGEITVVGDYGVGQSSDAWILRLSSNGTVLWKKRYGGSSSDAFFDILSTGNGNYLVAGATRSFGNGGSDGWAIEIDDAGRVLWQRTYGGEADEWLFGVVATGSEELTVYGTTESFGSGGLDGWLVGIDANGVPPAGCSELSRITSVKPKTAQASVRSISVAAVPSSAVATVRSMYNKKSTLATSDLCSSAIPLRLHRVAGPTAQGQR